jgi:hypothetical protein
VLLLNKWLLLLLLLLLHYRISPETFGYTLVWLRNLDPSNWSDMNRSSGDAISKMGCGLHNLRWQKWRNQKRTWKGWRDHMFTVCDNRSAKITRNYTRLEDSVQLGDRGTDGGSKFNGVGTNQNGSSPCGWWGWRRSEPPPIKGYKITLSR